MTIHYEGINPSKGMYKRTAVIYYNMKKEQPKADEIFERLEGYGWDVLQEEESAYIPVVDRYEYNQLLIDYKYAKRIVK